jgi:hypothetical protein
MIGTKRGAKRAERSGLVINDLDGVHLPLLPFFQPQDPWKSERPKAEDPNAA